MFKILGSIVIVLCFACNGSRSVYQKNDLMKREESKNEIKDTISAPVVRKASMNKAGKSMGADDFYVQRSVQDYFIKFCEGNVSKDILERKLAEQKGLIKSLKMVVSFREGEWDSCPGQDEQVQSRIGNYIIIHEILE